VSTLLTLCFALPGAYIFSHYQFVGKTFIRNFITVAFVLPTVVTAAAFKALLGSGGVLNEFLMHIFNLTTPPVQIEQSVYFFILAHIFYNYAIFFQLLSSFWEQMPQNLTDAAIMLGASQKKAFLTISLPLLAPVICAASLLVFVFCFTSFGVVLILGGPRLATLEVEIYRQAIHMFNLPAASALSLVQLLITGICMLIYTRMESHFGVSMIPEMDKPPNPNKQSRWSWCVIFTIVLLIGSPVMALFIKSIQSENGLSLKYYVTLFYNMNQSVMFVPPLSAILNSIGFAISAMIVAIIFGWLAAAYLYFNKTGFVDALLMLPLSTSAVTLGFGFIIAFNAPPLNLRTSIILPIIAHALIAIPFVIRSILPAWRSIPLHIREASALLGASPMQTWLYIDWPLLKPSVIVAAIFSFAISMGEFGATMFVARPQTPTMPVAIYRYLSLPGSMNYGQAMAMSCLLILTTIVGFFIIPFALRNGFGRDQR